MKKKDTITEVIFILDESWSMYHLREDTIGWFNSMLQEQKDKEWICNISAVFFSDYSKVVYNHVRVDDIEELTSDEYRPHWCTALIDAIWDSVNHMINYQKKASDTEKADNIVFFIMTDWEENSSHKYSSDEVKKMIEEQQKEYNWKFVFLGANIDAVETARTYWIDKEYAANFSYNREWIRHNYEAYSDMICEFRRDWFFSSSRLDDIREFEKNNRQNDNQNDTWENNDAQ